MNSKSKGYNAIHHYHLRNWVKTGVCEHCNETKKTNWANKSGKYLRGVKSDWLELCAMCHRTYDIAHAGQFGMAGYRKCVTCKKFTRKHEELDKRSFCFKCYEKQEVACLQDYAWYNG